MQQQSPEVEGVENRLDDFITQAIEWLEKAGDFVAEQAPILVQELLTYKMVQYTIFWILFVFIAVLFILVGRWLYINRERLYPTAEECRNRYTDFSQDSVGTLYFTFKIGGSILIAVSTAFYLVAFLEIYLAPRVYILNYLRRLL